MKGLFLTSRRCKFQLVSSWISGVKLTNALHPRAPQRPAFQNYCFQHSILLTPSNWDGTLLQRVLDKQHILETFWKTACVSQRLGANHRSKESKFSFPRCPKYDTHLSVSGRLPLIMYLPPSPCHCVVMIASPACHSTQNSSVPSATSEPTQRDVRAVRDADTDPQRGPDHCICPLKISPNFD